MASFARDRLDVPRWRTRLALLELEPDAWVLADVAEGLAALVLDAAGAGAQTSLSVKGARAFRRGTTRPSPPAEQPTHGLDRQRQAHVRDADG